MKLLLGKCDDVAISEIIFSFFFFLCLLFLCTLGRPMADLFITKYLFEERLIRVLCYLPMNMPVIKTNNGHVINVYQLLDNLPFRDGSVQQRLVWSES